MMFTVDPPNPNRFLGDLSDTIGVALKDANGTTMSACEPDYDGPHACIEDLVDVIEGKRTSQFSGTEGRAALRIVLAALEAVEIRKSVLL